MTTPCPSVVTSFCGAVSPRAASGRATPERAAAAALRAVGGGSASAVERDDDAAYEVEVRRANGSTVDVDVDGNYRVVAIDDDSENSSADDDRESGDADD